MYRLLIVDDEPEIAESLYELLIEQDFPQIDILMTYSSAEALTIINTSKIDILLTDIKMPEVSGLQLVEAAKRNWPNCRSILLTGYNEFNYVYSAIKNECEDYILKTDSDLEIIKAVEKAYSKIEKSLQDEDFIRKAREQLTTMFPVLQREYIMKLVEGMVEAKDVNQEQLNNLRIPLNVNTKIIVILAYIDEAPNMGLYSSLQFEFMLAVKVVLEETLCRYSNKVVIEYRNRSFLIILQQEPNINSIKNNDEKNNLDDMELIKGSIELIQDKCRVSLNSTISCVLCSEPIKWEYINQEVNNLQKIMEFSTAIGSEALLTDKSFSKGVFEKLIGYKENSIEEALANIKHLSVLENYLERGIKDQYYTLLGSMIDILKTVKSFNNNIALEIYFSVAKGLISYMNRWKITDTIAFQINVFKLARIDLHKSWNEVVQYLYDLSEIIFETQKSNQNKIAEDSIESVKKFINEHLNEELSLGRLAKLIYFNSSYLSRLFKQTTNMNVSDYILVQRIEKAKELLSCTELKIHQITLMIGLDSATYFGRVFKKVTGMTPVEYREHLVKLEK